MAFGEREPVLVARPMVMSGRKDTIRDARISGNLGDRSALEIECREVLEDVVDVGVVLDLMMAFHDAPQCLDHQEDERVNDQSHKPKI
jgi:hypothetical protein